MHLLSLIQQTLTLCVHHILGTNTTHRCRAVATRILELWAGGSWAPGRQSPEGSGSRPPSSAVCLQSCSTVCSRADHSSSKARAACFSLLLLVRSFSGVAPRLWILPLATCSCSRWGFHPGSVQLMLIQGWLCVSVFWGRRKGGSWGLRDEGSPRASSPPALCLPGLWSSRAEQQLPTGSVLRWGPSPALC